MKLVRFLPWSVVLIGLILAIAWSFRITVVSTILDRVVRTTEIRNLDYQLESISTSSAFFSDLTFEISSQKARYQVLSENLNVAFTVDNLGSGRVDSLHISNLSIREERSREGRSQLNSGALLFTLVSALDRSLPFQSIVIDELSLSSGAFNPTQSHPIQLQAHSTPAGMIAKLHHHRHTLDLTTARNTLDLRLKDRESQSVLELILTMDYSEAGGLKGMFGNLDMRTGHVLDWWKTFSPAIDTTIEGRVAGQFHVESENDSWRLKLNGTSEQLAWKDSVVRNGLIVMDAEIPDILDFDHLMARFNTGSKFTAETMETESFAMAGMALAFHGDLAIRRNTVEYVAGNNHSFTSSRLGWEENHFSKLEINSALQLRYGPDGLVLNIRDGVATAGESRVGPYILGRSKVHLQSPMRLAMARSSPVNDPQGWVIDRGRIAIPNFSLAGDHLSVHSEDLTFEAEVLTPGLYKFRISAMDTDVQENSTGLDLGSLSAQITLEGHELDAAGSFSLSRLPGHYEFQLDADLQGKAGDYTVKQTDPLDILGETEEVNSVLSNWAPDLYLTEGTVWLVASGHWENSQAAFHRLDVEVSDVVGGYSELSFAGLDFHGPLYFPPIPQSDSATVEVETIAYGVVAENIVSDIRLSTFETGTRPGVRINRLEGEVLGSRFVCENCSFDPDSSVNSLSIALSGLDIEELVKLQEINGLKAHGKIDGLLPVEISKGGIRIKKGKIWSQQDGGIIQYFMEPGQTESLSNLLTDPVIRALEDFNYDVLTGSVEYEPDGNLLVKLHIEGTSPNIENSQPLHLNINTEQNMLLLLKSLEYAERLGDKLDDKIRDQVSTSVKPGSSDPLIE